MNHNQRKFYAGDFEESRFRMNRAFLGLVIALVALVALYAAFLAGAVVKDEQYRERARIAAASVRPTNPVPAHALTQWTCNEHEFSDHMNTCIKRGIKPPRWYRFTKPLSQE